MNVEKVIIIGSGPAGLTAALYSARAALKPLIIEGISPNIPGGQLMLTSQLENFPGFPKGIDGSNFIKLLKKQASNFGAKFKLDNVKSVNLFKRPFNIVTNDTKIQTHALIIATGANAKLLGLINEIKLMKSGGGVSTCATCDGSFYKNLEVAVVGGGDSAMEEALFLTRFASKVIIIHRRSFFRASKVLLKRAEENVKIHWKKNTILTEIITKKTSLLNKEIISGIKLKNIKNNNLEEQKLDGLFIAIGHSPNTLIFKDQLKLDSRCYLITAGISSKTNINGVFACGDVQDSVYRQAVTASASGCIAGIDAEHYLESLGI